MYKYYNANPKNLMIGDCVKKAIVVAAGMDYKTVQRELNRHKRVTGAEFFNSHHNPDSYVLNVLHAEKLCFSAGDGAQMTVGRFCEEYPVGRYILVLDGHWTPCVDGVIYDMWYPEKETVYSAYKIEVQ